jgi:hypothetical protein
MYICLHVKCPLFLTDFNETWILSTVFEKYKKSDFMKIRPVGAAELFHTDGHTNRQEDEDNSCFQKSWERA